MKRIKILISLVVIATFVLALMPATAALAAPPTKAHLPSTASVDLGDVCLFSVHLDSTMTNAETDFFDQSGALKRIFIHVVAQDTLTANGKALVGIPYTYNLDIIFDSSGIYILYAEGIIEKIPLPDGSLFFSAGRVDIMALPTGFTITPDMGKTGNVAGLCAALS